MNASIPMLMAKWLRSSPLLKSILGFLVFASLFVLSPLRHIKLGYLHADSLGGFISQSDMVLSLRTHPAFKEKASALYVFVLPKSQANTFVVDHYVRHLRHSWKHCMVLRADSRRLRIAAICALALAHLSTQTGRFTRHYCGAPLRPGLDARAFVEDVRPHRFFAENRAEQLQADLEVLGLDPDQPYICFDHRSSEYWNVHADRRSSRDGGGDTQDFRNVPVDNYMDGLREVRRRGLSIIRMGFHQYPDPQLESIGIIDYATSPVRSAELDVFLFGRATAAVFAGASGIAQLATSQHIPVFVADYRPLTQTEWGTPNFCLMPSLMWDSHANNFLTLSQMLRVPFNVDAMYLERNMSFLGNSSLDIYQGVTAFLTTVLDGSRQPSDFRQERFWELVAAERPNYTWQPRPPMRRVKVRLPFLPSDYGLTPRRSWVPLSFLQRYSDVLGIDQEPIAQIR